MASSATRGSLWSDNEVRAIIAIWGESDVQDELDGAVRNKVVFQEIARKLKEQGYNRDLDQCRNKIKNLKNTGLSKITMEKQEGEGKHANSTEN